MIVHDRVDRELDWFGFVDDLRQAICEINMALKIAGVAQKMALLHHNLDLDADQLSAGIDAADAKRQATVAKSKAFVADAQQNLADVDSVLTALDTATNNPPATPLPPAVGIDTRTPQEIRESSHGPAPTFP